MLLRPNQDETCQEDSANVSGYKRALKQQGNGVLYARELKQIEAGYRLLVRPALALLAREQQWVCMLIVRLLGADEELKTTNWRGQASSVSVDGKY